MCFVSFAVEVMKGKLEKQKYILSKYENKDINYQRKDLHL